MASPQLTQGQIEQVSMLVAEYIENQRKRYTQRALPMPASQKAIMAGFFSARLLDSALLAVLHGERVDNPKFYPMLRGWGFNNLPNYSEMAAITFSDIVVFNDPVTDGFLFHELVHVEQYRQVGIHRFAELYVCGFLNSGSYDAIPLEVNAYSLGGRFEANLAQQFSVEDEVRNWIARGKF
jgi:hypothetical protein